MMAAMAIGSGLACSSVLPKRDANWVEVCTRHGRRMMVDVSRPMEQRSPRDSVESQGCQWCVPQAVQTIRAAANANEGEAFVRLQRFGETGPSFEWSDGELRAELPAV